MKTNFIVSPYRDAWIQEAKKLFIAEPYVHHVLKENNELNNYEDIGVVPHYRDTREKLIKDNDFVDEKYHRYIPILARRLNKIHGVEFDEIFWKKCFSLSLLRYITFYYDLFQRCEDHFDPALHDCNVISEGSYYTPKDFADHRDFFQTTAFGQEQIFSIYIHLFYPDLYKTINKKFSWPIVPSTQNNIILKIKNKLSRVTKDKIIQRLLKLIYKVSSPVVIITGSYFSPKNMNKVLRLGKGKIRLITISKISYNKNSLNEKQREIMAQQEEDFDKFDKFFFESIKSSMPLSTIENFNSTYKEYRSQLIKYNDLKYIINENWIGDEKAAIFTAIAQQLGVKHIYNEHNFLQYQFLRNNLKYLFPLVDRFITLGWYKKGISVKLEKGGSLYEWATKKTHKKNHNVLFISGPPAVKVPEFSSSYGDFGSYNAKKHLDFNDSFFSNLPQGILQDIVYRGYPLDKYPQSHFKYTMVGYDQEKYLEKYSKCFKLIDSYTLTAKMLMLRSKLVVLDYLSTSYIESMIANIPTIFFWNKDIYLLEDGFADFYNNLISVGICHTSPIEAAKFIEKVIVNPDLWWLSPEVQRAKDQFIDNNICGAGVMLSKIKELKV